MVLYSDYKFGKFPEVKMTGGSEKSRHLFSEYTILN
jgi:hypothetical protein